MSDKDDLRGLPVQQWEGEPLRADKLNVMVHPAAKQIRDALTLTEAALVMVGGDRTVLEDELRQALSELTRLRAENAGLREAMKAIGATSYFTEACNSEEENNEILAKQYFVLQRMARAALKAKETRDE